MQEQDGQIAHQTSYQDRDTGEECSRVLEFAMHQGLEVLEVSAKRRAGSTSDVLTSSATRRIERATGGALVRRFERQG
jgi:hypothetical protein